ncbi:MAG: hypothetical protein ACXWF8_05520 [Methylobacter sp.]
MTRDKLIIWWIKKGTLLTLLSLLASCLAAPVKLSTQTMAGIRTILVVPVESPPLEVIPDLIENRFPVYGQYQYQEMPRYEYLREGIYKSPGDVLIAGLVSNDDIVPVINLSRPPAATGKTAGLEPVPSLADNWAPTFILAQRVVSQLNGKATLSNYYYRLPIASRDRNANLGNWHRVIERWYGQNGSAVDYRQLGLEQADAVLEVGIRSYRIFEGQTSLQVLIKLIDSNTRQVIGRTSARTFSAEDSPQGLLANDATKFKRLVADMGAQLTAECLNELGLRHPAAES